MGTLACLLLIFGQPPAETKAEPPEVDGVKVVLDQIDKAWGIKFKSGAMMDVTPHALTELKMTLDFTKDVADLAEFKKAFAGSSGIPFKLDGHPLLFHLFDEDNVSIGKYVIKRTEGDLTGTKGDAFRLYVEIDKAVLKKAKKIEARLLAQPMGKH